MKTGFALFCVIGLTIVFAVWDGPTEYLSLFPYSKQKLTLQTHIYFIFEHVTVITILYLWYNEASEYSKHYVLMFLFLQIGNLVDYLLRYNEPFLKLHGRSINYNIVSIVLYALFLSYKGWKDR